MKTDDLIHALAADHAARGASLGLRIGGAAFLGFAVAAVLFAAILGPRPDFASALGEPRFVFKFVVTLLLAASSFGLGLQLVRPGGSTKPWALALAAVALLLGLAVVIELSTLPPGSWRDQLIGSNSLLCLASVPLLALPVLLTTLAILRRGAPVRPAVTGAVAGLFAAGLGAALYAAHCIDDSPLFVAAWYSLAIAIVAAVGALAGWRALRW
jgi:hypothetical protein